MAAADPKARIRNARLAAHVSWARTENRGERAARGHKASPQSLEYWLAWAKDQHPDMAPADQAKAAENAYRAHMQRLSRKAIAARTVKRLRALYPALHTLTDRQLAALLIKVPDLPRLLAEGRAQIRDDGTLSIT